LSATAAAPVGWTVGQKAKDDLRDVFGRAQSNGIIAAATFRLHARRNKEIEAGR
jgi:hypothetical protein